MNKRFKKKLTDSLHALQRFADRSWFPPLVGVLVFLDYFLFIVPNDGIFISSVLLAPRRWLQQAICISVGCALGGLILAILVQRYGLSTLLTYYPELTLSSGWQWTQSFFEKHGLWVVFVSAALPLVQQPPVILAALAGTSWPIIAGVILAGRLLKYLSLGWVAAHAPHYLSKKWGDPRPS